MQRCTIQQTWQNLQKVLRTVVSHHPNQSNGTKNRTITHPPTYDDAILPYGFRAPAQHQNTTDPTIGTVVWDYKPPVCPKHGDPVQGFQTLYKGETNVKIKTTATLESQFEGALFSATNKMLQNAKIPQNFALAIHSNTSLCGQLAYSTNICLLYTSPSPRD